MVISKEDIFRFKQFEVRQDLCTMKVNSDGVLLGAWANVDRADTILDIGAGSGVVGLMLAQKRPDASIVGVEIDDCSCRQAEINFNNSPWSKNLTVVESGIQEYGKNADRKFDHIVSNPPFFSGGTLSDNQPKNIVRHTVKMSHGDLLLAIRRLLADDGKCSIILPVIEGLRFIEIVERYSFYITRKTVMRPREGKPLERILFEFSKVDKGEVKEQELVMYVGKEIEYTDDYKDITRAYYLKL